MTDIPTPPLALRLMDLLGGTFDGETIHVDGHRLDCRPNGDVVLDGSLLIGRFSDGADLLAAKYRAATVLGRTA